MISITVLENEILDPKKYFKDWKIQRFKEHIQAKTVLELEVLMEKCLVEEMYEQCAVIRDRLEELNEKV